MAQNAIRTSKKVATKASKVLTNKNSSKISKTLAGAGLGNRRKSK